MRKDMGPMSVLFPHPVLIVGTYNEDGTANAMNATWGGICGMNRINLYLTQHKTTDNIERNKEFTVGIADVSHMVEADFLGLVSGKKVPNKLEVAGLHTSKAKFVNAPMIEELPITFECKLLRVTEDGTVGEIVNVCVDENVLNEEGNIDILKLDPLTYDSVNSGYISLGTRVGNAQSDGKKLLKS